MKFRPKLSEIDRGQLSRVQLSTWRPNGESRRGLDVFSQSADAKRCRNKRLVYQILSFLAASLNDGSIRTDDAEGIEIASQCISEAFDVDLAKAEDKAAYALPSGESLAQILEKHVQTSTQSTATTTEAIPAVVASAEDKAKAEKAKLLGNQKMAAKDYDGAIAAYGDAIALDGKNPVYWSNRSVSRSSIAFDTDSLCSKGRRSFFPPSTRRLHRRRP